MSILAWLVSGLIAGWFSGAIVRGGGLGLIGDVLLGAAGALMGGLLAALMLDVHDAVTGLNLTSIGVALLGAIAALSFFRLFARPIQEL